MAAPEDGFELTPSIKAAAEVATRAATTDRAALVSALERVLATIPTRVRACNAKCQYAAAHKGARIRDECRSVQAKLCCLSRA